MKKSILFILLIGMTLLNSCETQEIVLTEQNNSNPIYNSVISSYLTSLKSSVSDNKENNKKISALMDAIDYSSVKQYDLKNTIELVVIDLKNFTPFNEVDQTKIIFFVLNNSIIRSNIVTFKNKLQFENPDQVIVSIFDKKENKDNYSGKIEFYNLFQNILLSNEFENGKLAVNGIARIDAQKSLTAKCTAWYWVTTYASGRQTANYIFTTCDCEEATYRTECGGGGGSDSSTNNIPGRPNYPSNPKDTNLFTYIDWDGELVTKKFNEEIGIWELVSISLSEVTIRNNPKKYDFLLFAWPQDLQKIINNNIIYTYEGASGSWEGEPATVESIAQAIEDQIDDSKLDPCLKAILDQLKNTTNNDIALILKKLGANSIYEVNMVMGVVKPGNIAETTKISKNNYLITYTQDSYTSATKLHRATTLLHELIHAYMLSVVDDYDTYPTNAPFDNFPELFKIYVSKINNVNNAVYAQHEDMANRYVEAIASAIEGYQANTGIPYTLADKQVFLDMAWSGLKDTDVFNKKFPIGSVNRGRILARIGSEQSNGNSAIGKPCN